MKKNCVIGQSGGPTAAINASLAGVAAAALASEKIDKVYGMVNGVQGLLEERFVDMGKVLTSARQTELLKTTPAAYLGSCRFRLPEPETDTKIYETIFGLFEKHHIGYFFYIGGNDSMDTVDKLSKYVCKNGLDVKIIGIPKTIDNDLCCTDHTPGFGSAAKYTATTVQEIIRDSSVYSIESVTIIEIMGRHAGWLTASTCVLRANGEAAPHLIYLPESKFNAEKFLADVRREQAKHKAVIIAVSEGIELEDDEFRSGATDNFGHKYLSGVGKRLENLVRDEIGCKARSIELNVMQRCSSHICSKTDIDESVLIGAGGVSAALQGESGKMMSFKRISDVPYVVDIEAVPASEVANKEKMFPKEWITADGTDVNENAYKYFLPLIQGELVIRKENGLPVHFKIREEILRG